MTRLVTKVGNESMSPLRMLQDLDRWDDVFNTVIKPFTPTIRTNKLAKAPAVDAYEEGNKIIVKADMPGIVKEDVTLTIEDGELVIKGAKKSESENKGKSWFRHERSYSEFVRRIPVNQDMVDVDAIKANMKDGVLTVTIPKTTEKEPHRITVN